MQHARVSPVTMSKCARWMRCARQPARFLVVGFFNTALSYLIYVVFVSVGTPFWAANFFSLICGIGIAFFTQGSLVFGNRDWRRFGRFLLTWLMIYVSQTLLIGWLISRDLSASIAGLLVLPGTAAASYVVQKYFVFRAS
jgi:putative flippase GtrA